MDLNVPQALLGAVFGLVLGSLLADPLKKAWSALGQAIASRKVRRIEGLWDSRYWYIDEAGERHERTDVVRLSQRGVFVTGQNEGPTDHRYEMEGRFRNETVLTGVWKSSKPEVTYHGTFQLIASANGRQITGKWLGLSNSHSVRHGEWAWQRRT